MINFEGKKEDMEFMQHNIIMYFRNEFGVENICETILADKVILDFYEDIILSDIVNVLNDCIYEFNEDFETLRKVYNVKSSFEILVGTTGNSFIIFKYKI